MADLAQLATEFAERLTDRVARILPDALPFNALVRPPEGGGRGLVSISTVDRDSYEQQPIRMRTCPGDTVVLRADYECCWDSGQDFLAIEKSAFKILPPGNRDTPLFRMEYVRASIGVPAAHIHVHGHRDELIHLMTRAGRKSEEKRGSRIPRMSDVHFPVGGHRFRPCLEDVLELVIDELGVVPVDGYERAIAEGRREWRKLQLRAAVRDAPEEAVPVLRSLGYTINFTGGQLPAENTNRLTAR